MSDLGAATWSEIDASNTATPPNGWPEGMFPSDVNNSARANMGGEKRWWDRSNSVFTSAGSSTVYTLTYTQAAASYYNGEEFSFIVDETCGAAPTLNVDGLGARNLRKFVGGAWVNLAAGDIVANQPLRVRYNLADTKFDIVTGPPIALRANLGTGYQELVPGIVMQWGIVSVLSGGSTAVVYALAFSSAAYTIQLTERANNTQPGTISASSTTGFTAANPGAAGTSYYWLAIGPA